MTKAELRLAYKEKRKALPVQERIKMDDLILIQFQQLGLPFIDVLMSYWPMDHHAEPNTEIYSRYLHHLVPGLQTAYPVTDFENLSMEAVIVNDETVFESNEKGLIEPRNGATIDPHEIDLVFVPHLICDLKGYRVGYGKGFYDRFLSRCREDVITVGFSYFDPVDTIEDTTQFDVPLNYCITPGQIYEF
ncbi:MAG: 5-formyltetrahydrofolate cyclo-ligase [Chitinophagaceae bacterium]|nr:5-formyltetrahydrofolate cyclo-ligase [Chitinophagaceae bacterium]